jgi:hypothetical protein
MDEDLRSAREENLGHKGGAMRTILLLSIFLALSLSTAAADPPPDIKKWITLNLLTDNDAGVEEHLRSHGFSESSIKPLVEYMKNANATHDEWQQAKIQALCNDRDRYAVDVEALASFIDRMSAEEEELESGFARGVDAVLSDVDVIALNQTVAHGIEIKFLEFDSSAYVRSGETTPATVVDTYCGEKEEER